MYLGFTLCIFFKKLKPESFFKKLKSVCYRCFYIMYIYVYKYYVLKNWRILTSILSVPEANLIVKHGQIFFSLLCLISDTCSLKCKTDGLCLLTFYRNLNIYLKFCGNK